MAKARKKKKEQAQGAYARVIENGVSVSVHGNDRGYAGLSPRHVEAMGGIVLTEMQQTAREKRSTVGRRTDHIDRLLADGVIDARLADCAGYFRADMALALKSGYKKSSLEIISGGGEIGEIIRNDKAWRKVAAVIDALGGNKSALARAAVSFIIEEKPFASVTGKSGSKRMKEKENLIVALRVIADYYYPLKKNS